MKPTQKVILQRAARYTAMATSIPGTIFAGYYLGYFLDQWLGTTWLRVAVMLLGIVGVFTQLIRQVLKDQDKK